MPRYQLPALPMLCAMAAMAIAGMAEAWGHQRNQEGTDGTNRA
jgi:hypothetical protein